MIRFALLVICFSLKLTCSFIRFLFIALFLMQEHLLYFAPSLAPPLFYLFLSLYLTPSPLRLTFCLCRSIFFALSPVFPSRPFATSICHLPIPVSLVRFRGRKAVMSVWRISISYRSITDTIIIRIHRRTTQYEVE